MQRVFERTGLSFEDIGLIELNEAFAAQVLAVLREWQLPDEDIVNVNGSGISLGHPIGATGARILATLLHEMERRERALWPGDDVRWRRPRGRRHLRAALVYILPSARPAANSTPNHQCSLAELRKTTASEGRVSSPQIPLKAR